MGDAKFVTKEKGRRGRAPILSKIFISSDIKVDINIDNRANIIIDIKFRTKVDIRVYMKAEMKVDIGVNILLYKNLT